LTAPYLNNKPALEFVLVTVQELFV